MQSAFAAAVLLLLTGAPGQAARHYPEVLARSPDPEVLARSPDNVSLGQLAAAQRQVTSRNGPPGGAIDNGDVGEAGLVSFVYSFGALAAGSPGLQNQGKTETGCLPGVRAYHTQKGKWWGEWVDFVPRALNWVFYWHAHMPVLEIQLGDTQFLISDCDARWMKEPTILWGSYSMHAEELYIQSTSSFDPWFANMTIFASRSSYIRDPGSVGRDVQQYGWRLVGSAQDTGGYIYGGHQVSHLLQHPDSLDCVITFQGTASLQGWVSNFDIRSKSFCGLSDPGEWCLGTLGECHTRRARGSFVHAGFVDRLRVLVQSDAYQQNIHHHLPVCNKVYAVGHSLGGAMAELFSTCVSAAWREGDNGYEDYKWMGWTNGVTRAAPWIY